MKNFSNYFKKERWVNPDRNPIRCDSDPSRTTNSNGTILEFNTTTEQRAFATPKRLWPPRRGIISNGAILLVSWVLFFPCALLYAGSIRDVGLSVKLVQSVGRPFQFAVIGDSQDGEEVYTRLIRAVADRKPHFLIHLGDMVHRPNEKEWQAFFEITKHIHLPFFPVTGNHDVGVTARGREIYRKQLSFPGGKTYYAFRAGEVLFVILDSEEEKGRIIKEQRAWLEDTLKTSGETFKLVFVHRPLFLPKFSLKTGRALDKYPLERDDLHRLFAKTGVKAVFAGDDHRYDRAEKDGLLYLISGGGGGTLGAPRQNGGYFHYVFISVQKEKTEGEAVDVEGRVQDRFVIE
jgi:predicted phosphodiesterase